MTGPQHRPATIVDILTVEDCPSQSVATAVAERAMTAAAGVTAEIRTTTVADVATAVSLGFIGSPTIRVNGRDVEPGADARTDYGLCCRLYRASRGLMPSPDEDLVYAALIRSESGAGPPAALPVDAHQPQEEEP